METFMNLNMDYMNETTPADVNITNGTIIPDDLDDAFVFENYIERIIIAILYCIVTIVGIVGNSAVILAVLFSQRLRSSTNWFVINLALADFLTCLSLPYGVTALLSKNGWPLPSWVCSLAAAIGFVCIGVSVMTLALIAYNRWYLLTQPRTKFKSFYSIRNIAIMLAVVWLYALLLVLAPHFAGLGKLGYSHQYKFCWHDTTVPTSDYYSLLAGPCMILPFTLFIVIVYVRIFVFVSRHNKVMRDSTCRSTQTVDTPHTISTKKQNSFMLIHWKGNNKEDDGRVVGFPHDQEKGIHQQLNRAISVDPDSVTVSGVTDIQGTPVRPLSSSSDVQTSAAGFNTTERRKTSSKKSRFRQYRHHVSVTKRLSIVVLAFFVCLLPFGISSVVPYSEPGIPWTGLMTTFNSCLNPIIYAWTMPVFRRVMACIFFCRFRNIPNPSRFITRFFR